MPALDPQTLDRVTKRGVAQIIPEAEFVARLREGKPLRLKMGFDPSRPDLHLGHVVGLRKLRQLQDLGHELTLIVGDWTAQIGDPSGQSDTRSMLSADDVKANAETYMRQFFKVVDPDKTRAVYQSEWFGKFTLADVIRLTSRFTINQFLHRDDFAQRYKAQRPIAVTEMLYPPPPSLRLRRHPSRRRVRRNRPTLQSPRWARVAGKDRAAPANRLHNAHPSRHRRRPPDGQVARQLPSPSKTRPAICSARLCRSPTASSPSTTNC